MSGLHECPRCGYRFEDAQAVEAHLEACTGDSNGQETGRRFLVDSNEGGEIIAMVSDVSVHAWLDNYFADCFAEEDDPQLAVWVEYKDADGELWYVSDHEEYTLDAEEFGPIPSADHNGPITNDYKD